MPTPTNPPIEEPPPRDANLGILEHIAGWAVVLAFWGLVSIILTVGAFTDEVANFIWPGDIDRVLRLRLLIVSVKWNIRNRLRGLRNFVGQLGASTLQRVLGIIPARAWDEAGHFLGLGLPFWAFTYVRNFWIRRLQLVLVSVRWTLGCGRRWLEDLARQLGASVLQLLRGALPTPLFNVAASGLNLPFCFLVYVCNFWQTRHDQRDRSTSESNESSSSGANAVGSHAVEDRPESQHGPQDTETQPEASTEESENQSEASDDDEPMPKVSRDRSPPPPPPPGGICYSQDFGTLPIGQSRSSPSRQRTVPTARTLSPNTYPQSDSPDGIRERTSTSMRPSTPPPPPARADGPSSSRYGHVREPSEELVESERTVPDDRRASRTFTRMRSDADLAAPPAETTAMHPSEYVDSPDETTARPKPQHSSNPNEGQNHMNVDYVCWSPLCQGLPCECGNKTANTLAANSTCQTPANPPRKYSTWSPRRLGNALGCALDDLFSRLKTPPSPVFPPNRNIPVPRALASAVPPETLDNTHGSSTEVMPPPPSPSPSLSPSPSPAAQKFASMHSAKKSPPRKCPSSGEPLSNLNHINEEPESPPPISSPKKRNKKAPLPSSPRPEEPKTSFGINHQWSGSDSGMLPGLRPENVCDADANGAQAEVMDENVELHQKHRSKGKEAVRGDSITRPSDKPMFHNILSARVPDEPNPTHLFGSHMSFMSTLTLPLMPSCEHYSKPSTIYEPPPDILDSLSSTTKAEPICEPSITDHCEEAYINSFLSCDHGDGGDDADVQSAEERSRSLTTAAFRADSLRLGDLIDRLGERGRAAAAMPAEAGPSPSETTADPRLIDDEDRRDSTADKVSTPPSGEPQDRGSTNVQSDPALQDLEWTSQPRYSDADFDEPLKSPSSSQRTALKYRNDRDNASISTTSKQRARSSFRLNGNTRQWNPFQPKSTASVGISGGHGAMGKMSLREAVSPTRKGRKSVTENEVSDALQRSQRNFQLESFQGEGQVGETTSPRAVQRSPRALFGSSSETAFEANDDDGKDILPATQNRMPRAEDLDPELAALRKLANNTHNDPTLTNRLEASFHARSPPTPETGHTRRPQTTRNENVAPNIHFANPIASAPEASKAPLAQHTPHQRQWKHKRSQAVDLTESGGVRRRTNGDSSL